MHSVVLGVPSSLAEEKILVYFVFRMSCVLCLFLMVPVNPFMQNGISHSYQLDRASPFIFKGC